MNTDLNAKKLAQQMTYGLGLPRGTFGPAKPKAKTATRPGRRGNPNYGKKSMDSWSGWMK